MTVAALAMCFFSIIGVKRRRWDRITRSPRIGSAIHKVFFALWPLPLPVHATILVFSMAGIKISFHVHGLTGC